MFNTTFVSWDENLKLINISALEMCTEKHWYKKHHIILYRREKVPYFRPQDKEKFCNAELHSITNLKSAIFFLFFVFTSSISAIEKQHQNSNI